jgi:hypothetical protein
MIGRAKKVVKEGQDPSVIYGEFEGRAGGAEGFVLTNTQLKTSVWETKKEWLRVNYVFG